MKIAVFGADGQTGVEVVAYATAKHIEVVAFVYNARPNTFPTTVEVKRGDVLIYDDVYNAIKGVDAVVSVLGHIAGSDPLMQTKGMTNIVKAMEQLGVKRLLSLTGTGARVAGDTPSLADRLLNLLVKLVDPVRINDAVEHVKVLQQSHLSWTVVRLLKLTNSQRNVESYTLTPGGPAELYTSRKKAAKVLVDLINDTTYVQKLPVISKG